MAKKEISDAELKGFIKEAMIETFFETLLEQEKPNPFEVYATAMTIAQMYFKKPKAS